MPNIGSMLGFLRHFASSYAATVPRIAYRATLSCVLDPKGTQKFLDDTMDAMDFASDDRVLGSADIREIFPGDGEITLKGPWHTRAIGGTCHLLELGCLAHVVRSLDARTIFEIGTFIGRTTRLFALNAHTDSRILTLDLPQEKVPHIIGRDFAGTPEGARITQLVGDSRSFDYSPWHGRCDFVWVDACHDYEFVASDTKSAIELCRPGGWIGWHDYWHTAGWIGVTRLVREVSGRFPFIRHIRGTTIVLAQRGA